MTPATAFAPRRAAPTARAGGRQKADEARRHIAAKPRNKGDTGDAKGMTPGACKGVAHDTKSLTPATSEPELKPAAEPTSEPSTKENPKANSFLGITAAAVEGEIEDETLRELHERIAQADSALQAAREALPAELRTEQETLVAEFEAAKSAVQKNGNADALGNLIRVRKAHYARQLKLESTPEFARVLEFERVAADVRKELACEQQTRRVAKARERQAQIERRLREAGNDDAFLARLIPNIQRAPQVFEKVLTEFDRQRERIVNPGGWMRTRLRAEGVTLNPVAARPAEMPES